MIMEGTIVFQSLSRPLQFLRSTENLYYNWSCKKTVFFLLLFFLIGTKAIFNFAQRHISTELCYSCTFCLYWSKQSLCCATLKVHVNKNVTLFFVHLPQSTSCGLLTSITTKLTKHDAQITQKRYM